MTQEHVTAITREPSRLEIEKVTNIPVVSGTELLQPLASSSTEMEFRELHSRMLAKVVSLSSRARAIALLQEVAAMANKDAALDRLYDALEEGFLAADFEFGDSVLTSAQPHFLGVELTLGLLTVTLRWQARLEARERFKSTASAWLSEVRGSEVARELIQGL